jgi:hypothetical protein
MKKSIRRRASGDVGRFAGKHPDINIRTNELLPKVLERYLFINKYRRRKT